MQSERKGAEEMVDPCRRVMRFNYSAKENIGVLSSVLDETGLWVDASDAIRIAEEYAKQEVEIEMARLGATGSWIEDEIYIFRSRAEQAEAERDEARANYAFMVQRAADEKLDGYRELASKLEKAEAEVADAKTDRDAIADELSDLEGELDDRLPAWEHIHASGDADEQNLLERVTTTVDEWRREKARGEKAKAAVARLEANMLQCHASRTELDCQFAGAFGESDGASHCPPDKPCLRCELERERDHARLEVARLRELLDGGSHD